MRPDVLLDPGVFALLDGTEFRCCLGKFAFLLLHIGLSWYGIFTLADSDQLPHNASWFIQ